MDTMVDIQSNPDSARAAFVAASGASAAKPAPKAEASDEKTSNRAINDTVELSDGAKIVNLARGHELAEEIRSKPIDENFAADLDKAVNDVFRITNLFKETLKAAFGPRV